MSDVHRWLSQNIRRLAKARKIPLTHLADRAGVSRAELFNVLKGERSPTLRWVEAVAAALEVPVADLVREPPAAAGRAREPRRR